MSDSLNAALLEQRIAALEAEIASLSGGDASRNRAGGRPPKPTNFAAATQPGVIAIFWDDSPIYDLDHYEVEVADNDAFTGASSYTTTNASFTYYEGIGGVTYYLRVRTRNRSNQASEWTAPVETGVGLVDSELLDQTANISLDRFVQTSGFSTLNTNGATSTFGPCEVTCATDSTVVDIKVSVIGALDVSFPSTGQICSMQLTLMRRTPSGTDSTVWDVQRDFSYARGGSGAGGDEEFIAFPPFAEQPGEGDWEYRLKVTLELGGSNVITFTPSDVRVVAITFN